MSVVASRQHQREKQVEQIVRRHPEALDSYVALILFYWTEADGAMKYDPTTATFSIRTFNIYRLTSPEAVSRALRRVIEGKVKRTGVDKDEWRVREEEKYRLAYSKRNE